LTAAAKELCNLKRTAAAKNLDILFNPCRDPLTGTVHIVFFCVALDASRASARCIERQCRFLICR
jgi:hypothetical protein